MPDKATLMDTLTPEETAHLRAIETELARLVLVHTAMTEARLVAMKNVVMTRGGDPAVNDYSIDLDKGLLLKLEKPPVEQPKEADVLSTDGRGEPLEVMDQPEPVALHANGKKG